MSMIASLGSAKSFSSVSAAAASKSSSAAAATGPPCARCLSGHAPAQWRAEFFGFTSKGVQDFGCNCLAINGVRYLTTRDPPASTDECTAIMDSTFDDTGSNTCWPNGFATPWTLFFSETDAGIPTLVLDGSGALGHEIFRAVVPDSLIDPATGLVLCASIQDLRMNHDTVPNDASFCGNVDPFAAPATDPNQYVLLTAL